MDFKDYINGLIVSISAIFSVQIIIALLTFRPKQHLEENPMTKYRINKFFYVFNVWIYYPFCSIVLPLYYIYYSLFASNYDTLPRFTAAWIGWGTGVAATLVFSYLKKGLTPPQKPIVE